MYQRGKKLVNVDQIDAIVLLSHFSQEEGTFRYVSLVLHWPRKTTRDQSDSYHVSQFVKFE